MSQLEERILELFDTLAGRYLNGVVRERAFYDQLGRWLKPRYARALVQALVHQGALCRPAPGTLARPQSGRAEDSHMGDSRLKRVFGEQH